MPLKAMAWTLARHPELVVFAFRNPRKTKIMERLKLEGMKESSIKPFHGDKVLQTLMSELLTSVGATFFFETGTFRADSLIWVSKHSPPNIALFSCEVDKVYFEFAKARIGSEPSARGRATLLNQSSPIAISSLKRTGLLRGLGVFWLDAHWGDYWPLNDELQEVFSLSKAIMVIDDFQVPDRDEFQYDWYRGEPNCLEAIDPILRFEEKQVELDTLLPAYSAKEAGITSEALTGTIIFFLNCREELESLLRTHDLLATKYTRIKGVPKVEYSSHSRYSLSSGFRQVCLTKAQSAVRNLVSFVPGFRVPFLYGLYLRFVPSRLTPIVVPVTYHGLPLVVASNDSAISSSLIAKGVYEKGTTDLLFKILRPGMVMADIGANIGYFSLIASRLCGESGRVYSFEPESKNYAILLKNLAKNHCTNVLPWRKVVSNKNQSMRLWIDRKHGGYHSLAKGNIAEIGGFVEVDGVSLDNFFEDVGVNPSPDLIKIDAEGAEGLIIDGADRLLRNSSPTMILEFWPPGLRNLGTEPGALLENLRRRGYSIRVVDEIQGGVHDEPTSADLLAKASQQGSNSKLTFTSVNLLLRNRFAPPINA